MPKTDFQHRITEWYQRHKRDLPWREIDDPYKIWLSEVILQQTRVDQGLPYYRRFVRNYPTVQHLAEASEDQVLRDWEGLGYYSRARNLHTASKSVANEMEGLFPQDHSEILKLKGVGEYTAAAISSFAYNAPHAVVDGNVFRVLARFCGVDTPINTQAGKKEFAALAHEMLYRKEPGTYNQAIMEFGALQCVPKKPDCEVCPLQSSCAAFAQGRVDQLPVKQKKKYDRQRYFHYALLKKGNQLYVEQRSAKDIWNRLFHFYLVEAPEVLEETAFMEEFTGNAGPGEAKLTGTHVLKPHKLSHQSIHIKIFELEVQGAESLRLKGQWVDRQELVNYAFPKPLRAFLERKQLTLQLD